MRRLIRISSISAAFIIGLFLLFSFGPNKWQVFSQGISSYQMTGNVTYQFNTLKHPTGLLAWSNYLFIADTGNNVIRQFYNGSLSVVAGSGQAGYVDSSNPNAAEFNKPTGLAGYMQAYTYCACTGPHCCYILPSTFLYVNDTQNYVVRTICVHPESSTGPCTTGVSTVAGNHAQGYVNGPNSSAEFGNVAGIFGKQSSPSSSAPFYIADGQNNVIRGWDGANVSTFAGSGTRGMVNGYRTNALFGTPIKAAWDANGNMYVTDTDNYAIRRIDTSGNVTTFAGTGQPGFVNGSAAQAQFRFPTGIVFNPADGYLYVADTQNNAIRRIDANGNVSTYAGTGVSGLTNGSLSQAQFFAPTDLVIVNGIMFVSDTNNNVIRKIDMTTGTVSTYIS